MDNINLDVLSTLSITKLHNWLTWREEPDRNGKLTKVPYISGTDTKAKANDSSTWGTYEGAVLAYQTGKYTGIGFEFGGSGVIGIDLDHCMVDGSPLPWAQEIIDSLDSYTEVSVSGEGAHILAAGKFPVDSFIKGDLEIYAVFRYFALTGNIIGERDKIQERDDALYELYAKVSGKLAPTEPVSTIKKEMTASDIADATRWLAMLSIDRCESYDSWLKVGMALSELGEVGLALWDNWSKSSEKYVVGACKSKWFTIAPGDGITLASLRHWAEEDAVEKGTIKEGAAFKISTKSVLVNNDCVYVETQSGKKQVSTFVFQPHRMLEDRDTAGEDAMLGTIRANGKTWDDIVLPKSAFSSAAQLCRSLPSLYWQWLGTDGDTKHLLMYITHLLEEMGMPMAQSTSVIGRHEKYWVTKEFTMDKETIYSRGDAPILYRSPELLARNKTSDTSPNLSLVFPQADEYSAFAREVSQNLVHSNHPDAVALMTGWFFATPLMSIFQEAGIRFPHLNVFGTKGSGKTTNVLRLFLPLLGQANPSSWGPSTTMFVLMSIFASTNGIPASFGDVRASTMHTTRTDFLRLLRTAYDSGRDARGQADLTTKTFNLLAPVVVDGEDALPDPALRERTIFVNLNPEHIREDTEAYDCMNHLLEMPLTMFAGNYLRHTLKYGPSEISTLFDQYMGRTRECKLHLPDRIRKGMAVTMCGMHVYNEFMDTMGGALIPISVDSFLPMINSQNMLLLDGRSRSLVDNFVEDLVAYVAAGNDYHFAFLLHYNAKDGNLWFHLSSAMGWWDKDLRRRGVTGLELPAMRTQLMERTVDGYALPEQSVLTKNGLLPCFGVNLTKCIELGLSVPEKFDADTMLIRGSI